MICKTTNRSKLTHSISIAPSFDMVFCTAILFVTVTTLGLASAGTSSISPELNVALSRSGKSDFSGNLSPSVRWQTEGNVGGTDYEVRACDVRACLYVRVPQTRALCIIITSRSNKGQASKNLSVLTHTLLVFLFVCLPSFIQLQIKQAGRFQPCGQRIVGFGPSIQCLGQTPS